MAIMLRKMQTWEAQLMSFSLGNIDSIKVWPKDHSRDALAKNLPSFSPGSENQREAELKDTRLILGVE